jgi:hypothetical protein
MYFESSPVQGSQQGLLVLLLNTLGFGWHWLCYAQAASDIDKSRVAEA